MLCYRKAPPPIVHLTNTKPDLLTCKLVLSVNHQLSDRYCDQSLWLNTYMQIKCCMHVTTRPITSLVERKLHPLLVLWTNNKPGLLTRKYELHACKLHACNFGLTCMQLNLRCTGILHVNDNTCKYFILVHKTCYVK